MKTAIAALALTLTAAPALAADPLSNALRADGELCFTRSYDAAWLKAHRGQTVRDMTLAIAKDGRMRMRMQGAGKPLYAFGGCYWVAGTLNRGVQDNIFDRGFKPTTGVNCDIMTDTTGVSAEEGGYFPIDWRDGRTIEVHLIDSFAAWRSTDVRRNADFIDIKPADRILRLNRAPASACRELVARFAPGA